MDAKDLSMDWGKSGLLACSAGSLCSWFLLVSSAKRLAHLLAVGSKKQEKYLVKRNGTGVLCLVSLARNSFLEACRKGHPCHSQMPCPKHAM